MGQNPFEQKHQIDQLFKQRECQPKSYTTDSYIQNLNLSYTNYSTPWKKSTYLKCKRIFTTMHNAGVNISQNPGTLAAE